MATSVRMTYEEFLNLPDDGKRYELVDGELLVNPAPVPDHQRVVGNLYYAQRRYLEDHRGAEVIASPIDVVLSPDDVVEPDLIVVLAQHASIIGAKNVMGAPDIVIEVLSDGTRRRDEVEKRKLYARHGVAEYWVVDPVIDTVKIYRRTGDGFPRVAELTAEAGGAITSPLLPAFSLELGDVFPR